MLEGAFDATLAGCAGHQLGDPPRSQNASSHDTAVAPMPEVLRGDFVVLLNNQDVEGLKGEKGLLSFLTACFFPGFFFFVDSDPRKSV